MTNFLAGKKDPLASYHFQLELDGISEATFRECSGITSETQVVESKEAGPKGQTLIKKLPGALKWGDITLKRGFTDDMKLYEWRQEVVEGKMSKARRNGSIVVYDTEDKEVMRFNFTNGWPSKLEGPSLNSSQNEVAVESITIVNEGIVRAK